MKSEKNDKLTFSKIEILFMIVMVAIIIIGGLTVFSLTTRKQRIYNFKQDATAIVKTASNAYAAYLIQESKNIVKSTDGKENGMCITINGLAKNDFLVNDYDGWNGYVVIEEDANKQYHYTIWATDGKYVINGYDSNKIEKLSTKDGITKFNNDNFVKKVKTSFTGTTSDKGGTGTEDSVIRFESPCIDEKVE
jgi:type II secretory pathway pseudopilin PulG